MGAGLALLSLVSQHVVTYSLCDALLRVTVHQPAVRTGA